jgi:hypothetical protein
MKSAGSGGLDTQMEMMIEKIYRDIQTPADNTKKHALSQLDRLKAEYPCIKMEP